MLEAADYRALMLEAKVVHLKFRKRLHRQDKPIDAVYFPISCMVSLLVTNADQPKMEMATVGREGVVGASEVIQTQGAMGMNLIQIPGKAVKIGAEAFRKIMTSRPLVLAIIRKRSFLNGSRIGLIQNASKLETQVSKITVGDRIRLKFLYDRLEVGQGPHPRQGRHIGGTAVPAKRR